MYTILRSDFRIIGHLKAPQKSHSADTYYWVSKINKINMNTGFVRKQASAM
jgi:hypothetical protein